ncbi:MAG: 50S ribosomal protein L9 [Patescibacteria group bacterium]|jgi:large subunit ribosomal protein L9|nr:50S ribosomal protein L9 [Patescibacteria group bacterium]
MKIVLQKEVKGVGEPGDIKEVANGFAQNFLIPNGLAIPATEDAIKQAEKIATEQEDQMQRELETAQEIASKLDGKEITLKEKAEDGKLFGSISAETITNKLAEENIKINKNNIELADSIKEVGEHQVKIKLDHGLEAELKVVIEAV